MTKWTSAISSRYFGTGRTALPSQTTFSSSPVGLRCPSIPEGLETPHSQSVHSLPPQCASLGKLLANRPARSGGDLDGLDRLPPAHPLTFTGIAGCDGIRRERLGIFKSGKPTCGCGTKLQKAGDVVGIREVHALEDEESLEVFLGALLGVIGDQSIRTGALEGKPVPCQPQILIGRPSPLFNLSKPLFFFFRAWHKEFFPPSMRDGRRCRGCYGRARTLRESGR